MTQETLESIEQKLCNEIAVITSNPVKSIDTKANLASLGIDSLSLVEIFVAIEREFSIKLLEVGIANEDLASIRTMATKLHQLLG